MDHIPLKIKWFKGLKNYELYKDKPKNKLCVFAFYVEHTSDLKAYVPVLASGNFRQALPYLKFSLSVNEPWVSPWIARIVFPI